MDLISYIEVVTGNFCTRLKNIYIQRSTKEIGKQTTGNYEPNTEPENKNRIPNSGNISDRTSNLATKSPARTIGGQHAIVQRSKTSAWNQHKQAVKQLSKHG